MKECIKCGKTYDSNSSYMVMRPDGNYEVCQDCGEKEIEADKKWGNVVMDI